MSSEFENERLLSSSPRVSPESSRVSPPPKAKSINENRGSLGTRVFKRLRKSYRVQSLFTVKPLEAFINERESKPEGKSLAEKLGLIDLLGYGVGCTVGAGIYSLIGIGAGIAGPGILISFLVGAISAMFTALAYSEFAARVPVTGSAYSYAYASFGEFFAWIIGWNLTLEYCISSAAIARSWGDYFTYMWGQFGLNPPSWLNDIQLGFTSLSPAAAVIVLLCTFVMLFGITTSSTFNVIITILNVGVLMFFIGVGSCRVVPDNWVYESNSFVPYGAASIFAGAGTVFFSYLGFDMVSSLAEETKNPQKNLPRGIIGSLAIAAIVYVGVSLVATGLVPFQFMVPAKAPLAFALEQRGLSWAAKVITVGSLFGLTTACFTGLLGQPRIFYTMARDGLLFPFFQWTVKRSDVPVIGTLLTGIFTAGVAFFMTLDTLADAISIGTLMAFTIVCAGVMVLRYSGGPPLRSAISISLIIAFICSTFMSAMFFVYSETIPIPVPIVFGVFSFLIFVGLCFMKTYNTPLTFKCPLVPLVPCAGIAINMYMLAGLQPAAWIRLGVWLAIGMLIYFAYGIWRSKMRNYQSQPSPEIIINK
jgi:APA family basic amino acid/polyamine antiporter